MTPPPPAPAKGKLPLWVMIAGGSVLGCCLLTAVCGALGNSASGNGAATTAGGDSAPSAGTSAGEDVLFTRESGLQVASPMSLVGPQVLSGPQLLGAWREDQHGLGLRLDSGGAYVLTWDSQGRGVALGYQERGTWSLDQGSLTLTPASVDARGMQGNGIGVNGEQQAPGPARSDRLDGVLLEYSPAGGGTRRIDGLHLSGEKPPWYPYDPFDFTFRRAPSL